MKYAETEVVLQEVPDEITLAINISNCPYHCPGCHSPHLWEDIGTELTTQELSKLIDKNSGITCVAFMGGDIKDVKRLSLFVHLFYPCIKTAWYTGSSSLPIEYNDLDYIKIGRYDYSLGPLSKPTTNQRLYKIERVNGEFKGLQNITYRLWKEFSSVQ